MPCYCLAFWCFGLYSTLEEPTVLPRICIGYPSDSYSETRRANEITLVTCISSRVTRGHPNGQVRSKPSPPSLSRDSSQFTVLNGLPPHCRSNTQRVIYRWEILTAYTEVHGRKRTALMGKSSMHTPHQQAHIHISHTNFPQPTGVVTVVLRWQQTRAQSTVNIGSWPCGRPAGPLPSRD